MEKITKVQSKSVVLANNDVDTDQIIPARFLTTTSRDGLGEHLFAEWRFDADGNTRPEFILNQPEAVGCEILVAGDNFGCGSSREHAPWALVDYGFKAIISTSMADIFKSNALKNGLIPLVVDNDVHQWLLQNSGVDLTIDLDKCALLLPDGRAVTFAIDGFARHCLMQGVDELGFLLSQSEAISAFERDAG